MASKMTQFVCLNILAAAMLVCEAKDKQTVLLYNTSTVTAAVVAEAQQEASRIFREAGIELVWVDCPPMIPGRPETDVCRPYVTGSVLFLHLIPAAGAFPNKKSLAHATVSDKGGNRTTVFQDRFQQFMTSSRPCGNGQMLGHIMAHEMGHLLLLLPGHAGKGIMAGPWGKGDLQRAGERQLLFTADEAARMRGEVRKRAAEVHVAESTGYSQAL